MLTHSPRSRSDPNSPIPDPWEDSPNASKPKPWKFLAEDYPLLTSAHDRETLLGAVEHQNLLRLKGLKIAPLEILLQDELKLGIVREKRWKTQLERAFALLVWSSGCQGAIASMEAL